jgi:hypothetical protein
LANFTLTIAFLDVLFQITVHPNLNKATDRFLILGGIILAKYFSSSIRLAVDISLRRRLLRGIQFKFFNHLWEPDNHSLIARYISRDVNILLEFIANSVHFLYFPLAIAIAFGAVFFLEGSEGIVAVSTVFLFFLLSGLIAYKCSRLAEKIYISSKARIDKAIEFLHFRPYLKNWHELKSLVKIKKMTQQEISYRNRDSLYRSIDLYTILFGCTLPVIILLVATFILNKDPSNYLVLILWFATPLIALVMEGGRFFSDYKMAKCAYDEINKNLNSNLRFDSKCTIELNKDWEIWEASLFDNILHEFSPSTLDLATIFRLKDEFHARNEDHMQTPLQFLGQNISQGQKTRILLIRAIHLAIYLKKPLNINIPLDSLDPAVCEIFFNLLPVLNNYCIINLTDSQQSYLITQCKRSSTQKMQMDNKYIAKIEPENEERFHVKTENTSGFKKYYNKLMPLVAIIFIIPAFLLSLNGYIISENYANVQKISLLIITTFFAMALAVTAGYFIEVNIRNKSRIAQTKLLMSASLEKINDLQQILSKDFTIMVERISWYIHDIAWYQSLIIVAFFVVIFSTGYTGLLVNLFFLILILLICKTFSHSISQARRASVEGINESVSHLQNLCTTGEEEHNTFKERRAKWCNLGFEILSKTHINMVATKIKFSNIISTSTGFFIITIIMLFILLKIPQPVTVLVLTSLLAMESTIVNLFQALTGFNAQILSPIRLEEFPLEKKLLTSNIKSSIENTENHLIINECENTKLGIIYDKLVLEKGAMYSLSGKSGHGKTEYLKTISNFYYSQITEAKNHNYKNKVFYSGRDTVKVLNWLNIENLLEFLSNKIDSGYYSLVLFDEVLCNFDVDAAKVFLKNITNTLIDNEVTLILVDHRFELENNIPIINILNREYKL